MRWLTNFLHSEARVASLRLREHRGLHRHLISNNLPACKQLRKDKSSGQWQLVSFFLNSVTLSSVSGSNNELGLASCGGAQKVLATITADEYWGLRVGEDSSDLVALLAFDIHEEGVWGLYQSLKFVQCFLFLRIHIE